jgi:predicted Zn-dependent protease
MDESELRKELSSHPGSELFVQLAQLLISEERLNEALLVLLRGLSHAPSQNSGRLLLAQVYFELGFIPFAVEQIKTLITADPASETLRKLLIAIAPGEAGAILSRSDAAAASGQGLEQTKQEQVLAEADFDVDDL